MTIRFLIRTSVKFKPTDLESKVPLSLRFKEGTAVDKFLVTKIMVNPNLWDSKNQQIKSRMVCDEEMRQMVDTEVTAIHRFEILIPIIPTAEVKSIENTMFFRLPSILRIPCSLNIAVGSTCGENPNVRHCSREELLYELVDQYKL